ncbi:MAG: TerC family protein [Candidatus Acidiferrales bacterium]
MLGTPIHIWVTFAAVIAAALAVDLGVFHRQAHRVTLKQAMIESIAWVALSLIFNLWLYFSRGPQVGVEFLTGYVVEKSLSVDNIFIFILIFQAFRVPAESQHKVLFCGVLGALVLRAAFVLAGVELLRAFHFVTFVFGAILAITGIRMVLRGKRVVRPETNWLVRLARRFVPVQDEYEGQRFLVERDGSWNATPLFLALVAVEAMDIIFAIDSVPAVLAITRDTFIVYSSNAFAILGLRALYFALADILPRFRFLSQGLAAVLIFVGGKMVGSDWLTISAGLSLCIIAGILLVTILASLAFSSGSQQKSSV